MIKLKTHRMPLCNTQDIQKIMNVVENELKPSDKENVLNFIKKVTPKGLCSILHALRRWYSSNSYNSAKKLLTYHDELKSVMDLSAPIGTYRGFKVFRDSELSNVKIGDIIKLPVTRNGGCASFTGKRLIANRFSGKSKDKIGLVVKLHSNKNVKTFIVPPRKTKSWFNNLYLATMGKSFRLNEEEYAICVANNGPPDKNSFMIVKVIDVKK